MDNLNIIVLVWVLFALMWAAMAINLSRSSSGLHMQSSYNGALYLTGSLSILAFVYDAGAIQITGYVPTYIGLPFLFVGFALALYSRIVIKHLWSFNAHSSGEIVRCFPYNLIKHPIYSGQLMMCFGTSVLSKNIIVLFIFFIGTYWLLYLRAVKEEEILNKATKGEYEKQFFMKGRFIPRVTH
jgi:protein-S-isoprenylcysteine O-methyltransferase Ste14